MTTSAGRVALFDADDHFTSAVENAQAILRFERFLGIDLERGAQAVIMRLPGLDTLLTVAYSALYWPFVVGALLITARRDRAAFRLMRNALLISGAVGLVTMVLLPVAPPRMLAGYDDRVERLGVLGDVAHPSGWFNQLAAMPSFHVCWMFVAAFALRGIGSRWVRRAPPLVMSAAVVTTGNHYVVDAVAGAVLALVAWSSAPSMQRSFDQARSERRARSRPAMTSTTEIARKPMSQPRGSATSSRT